MSGSKTQQPRCLLLLFHHFTMCTDVSFMCQYVCVPLCWKLSDDTPRFHCFAYGAWCVFTHGFCANAYFTLSKHGPLSNKALGYLDTATTITIIIVARHHQFRHWDLFDFVIWLCRSTFSSHCTPPKNNKSEDPTDQFQSELEISVIHIGAQWMSRSKPQQANELNVILYCIWLYLSCLYFVDDMDKFDWRMHVRIIIGNNFAKQILNTAEKMCDTHIRHQSLRKRCQFTQPLCRSKLALIMIERKKLVVTRHLMGAYQV